MEYDYNKGLTKKEVEEQQDKFGYNELPNKKEKSLIIKFFESFLNPLILLLFIAASISFITMYYEHDSNYIEPISIIIIILINIIIELFQESKSRNSLKSLMKLTQPYSIVIRENKSLKIPTREIVVKDLVKLEVGDIVPADIKIISSNNLQVNESNLTGESVSINKKNGDYLYSSTIIVSGNCKGIVTKIGIKTEFGKISKLVAETDDEITPLENKLRQIGKFIGIFASFICFIIFIIGVLQGKNPSHIFMISVSLAVATVPEGLLTVITLILSKGVQNMAKNNAIIKKLSAIETLGEIDVICTDKTGTLTENKMKVISIEDENSKKLNYLNNNKLNEKQIKIIKYGALCTSILENYDTNNKVGDPTEIALVESLLTNNISINMLMKEYPKIDEIPFDSNRKIMSTFHNIINTKKIIMITKGAVDEIIQRSNNLSEKDKINILNINKQMAKDSLRVLAIAYKNTDNNYNKEIIENNNLIYLGLVGLIDPPKKTSYEAINLSHELNVKTIMITGDHIDTAIQIGKNLNIIKNNNEALNGDDLRKYTSKELKNNINKYRVYARVNPEDKLNIVKALQEENNIVAMIGDGVNDAPALKKANISCAMGITGTDVAKNISSLILTDDNFLTIVKAIKLGRITINNIKKTILFLFSSNIAEIVVIFLCVVLNLGEPLAAVHLLLINTITDLAPALALGVENINDIISRKNNNKLFNKKFITLMIIQGIYIAIFTLISFLIGKNLDKFSDQTAKTMTFITLSMAQIFHAYTCRSCLSLFKIGIFTNKYLNYATIISFIIILVITLSPFFMSIFEFTTLSFNEWVISLGLAFSVLIIGEIIKIILKKV